MTAIFIIGGAAGIGGAVARSFRNRGDDVLIADPDAAAAKGLAAENAPGRCIGSGLDFCDAQELRRLAAAVVKAFGGLNIVFVNVTRMTTSLLADWTQSAWDDEIAVNLRTPFLAAQAATPFLLTSGGGSIIFTGSTASLRGGAGSPAFHAAKAGLLGLCRSLAAELAPQSIRVNCILPGWIDTPAGKAGLRNAPDRDALLAAAIDDIPMRRIGLVEEAAQAVLFLASPASAYITGTTLVIDGGLTAI